MGGISQLPKCPPRQLPGSVSLVQRDRSLPRGISSARDPGTLAFVPDPSSVQSCAPACAGMGWGDENGSSVPVLSNVRVSWSGTLLLQQSLCCFTHSFLHHSQGCLPGHVGNRRKGISSWSPQVPPPNTGGAAAEWPELPHTQPDSPSEE